jgi:hypothetical protein
VGSVWSAADELGRPLTVAVLDTAASDQRWRTAFAQTVNALAQPGPDRPQYVSGEVGAAVPWAAYAGLGGEGAGAERVFESLGMQVVAEEADGIVPGLPVSGAGGDLGGTTTRLDLPQSSVDSPSGAWPFVAGQPFGSPAHPTSAQPMSGQPMSPAPDAYGLGYAPQDPYSPSSRRIVPTEPKRRRTGLWIGVAVLVAAFVAGGGAVFAVLGRGGGEPTGTTTSKPAPQQGGEALANTPPASPGIEPPKAGEWPKNWPVYTPFEKVRTYDLDGLGFPVKVPDTWQCGLAGHAEGFVKYTCGTAPGDADPSGGELVVRDCAAPCDGKRQDELRRAEEAWGAQWIRTGPYSTVGEMHVEVDGEKRHALVVVAFWRSGDTGEVDRQLVIRMTGEAQHLRKIASYLRGTLVF